MPWPPLISQDDPRVTRSITQTVCSNSATHLTASLKLSTNTHSISPTLQEYAPWSSQPRLEVVVTLELQAILAQETVCLCCILRPQ